MNHNSPSCCPVGLERGGLGLPCADIPPGTVGLSPEWQHTARLVNSISHFNCGSLLSDLESPPNAVSDIMVPVVSNAGYARDPRTYHHFNPLTCLLSAAVGYTEKATKPEPQVQILDYKHARESYTAGAGFWAKVERHHGTRKAALRNLWGRWIAVRSSCGGSYRHSPAHSYGPGATPIFLSL
jgi:hypothetical protein